MINLEPRFFMIFIYVRQGLPLIAAKYRLAAYVA